MNYIKEFEEKLNKGEFATDYDIENYIDKKQEECMTEGEKKAVAKDIWNIFDRWRAKGTPCEGCKYIGYWGVFPCIECNRKPCLTDCYEM